MHRLPRVLATNVAIYSTIYPTLGRLVRHAPKSWLNVRPFLRASSNMHVEAGVSDPVAPDLRSRLMSEVKKAMKSKDTLSSTTLRSVLSDVYAADKTTGQKLASPMIVSILRKGITRRNDAATKFNQASRFDLAEQELREAAILTQFLPPSLPQEEVDRALVEAIKQLPPGADPRKSLGMVFKIFFSNVDKSLVDTETVKRRAQELLAQHT